MQVASYSGVVGPGVLEVAVARYNQSLASAAARSPRLEYRAKREGATGTRGLSRARHRRGVHLRRTCADTAGPRGEKRNLAAEVASTAGAHPDCLRLIRQRWHLGTDRRPVALPVARLARQTGRQAEAVGLLGRSVQAFFRRDLKSKGTHPPPAWKGFQAARLGWERAHVRSPCVVVSANAHVGWLGALGATSSDSISDHTHNRELRGATTSLLEGSRRLQRMPMTSLLVGSALADVDPADCGTTDLTVNLIRILEGDPAVSELAVVQRTRSSRQATSSSPASRVKLATT